MLAGHVEHHGYMVDVDHHGSRVDDAALIGMAGKWGSVYDFGHDISRLNVENEFLLGLFKYKQADGESDKRHTKADQVFL